MNYNWMELLSLLYSCYVHNPDMSDHPNYMSRILVAEYNNIMAHKIFGNLIICPFKAEYSAQFYFVTFLNTALDRVKMRASQTSL